MAKFPEPPSVVALNNITPVLKTFRKGTLIWRIHFAGGHYPTRWNEFRLYGPTSSRFDHHLEDAKGQSYCQARGIMYLAKHGPTCVAEVFQATRVVDRDSRSPWLAGFKLKNTISLLDLTGVFATTIGASTAIHSGPRPRAQRWAHRLYETYPTIDGILYCSSMYGNAEAIALFERGARAIPALTVFHRALNDPAMLAMLAETSKQIGYQLV